MSGNGVYEPHNCTNALFSQTDPPLNCIPPGQGGGCVKTGPFKDYVVNFAPVFPSLAEPELNFSMPFLSYDPRCLKRDVSVWVSSNWTKDIDSYDLITQNSDIYWFQQIMQGNGFIDGFYGVHTAGEHPFKVSLVDHMSTTNLGNSRALHNRWRPRRRLLRFSG
jgi:tyrosinase